MNHPTRHQPAQARQQAYAAYRAKWEEANAALNAYQALADEAQAAYFEWEATSARERHPQAEGDPQAEGEREAEAGQ